MLTTSALCPSVVSVTNRYYTVQTWVLTDCLLTVRKLGNTWDNNWYVAFDAFKRRTDNYYITPTPSVFIRGNL